MGKLSLTKMLIITFFCSVLYIIVHSSSFAQPIIMINSQSSKPGEIVTFTVSISPGTDDFAKIRAFGFDIQYDDNILEYLSYSADSIKDSALFPPQINKRSAGSLRAGGGFINPVKIDKTIDLFYIDFKCLNCKGTTTSLTILGKIDDLKNFTSQNGTFNCLKTEEIEEALDQRTNQEKTDKTKQKDPKIIELTNQKSPQNQQKRDLFISTEMHHTATNEPSTGGGAAGGQTQKSSDISDLKLR